LAVNERAPVLKEIWLSKKPRFATQPFNRQMKPSHFRLDQPWRLASLERVETMALFVLYPTDSPAASRSCMVSAKSSGGRQISVTRPAGLPSPIDENFAFTINAREDLAKCWIMANKLIAVTCF